MWVLIRHLGGIIEFIESGDGESKLSFNLWLQWTDSRKSQYRSLNMLSHLKFRILKMYL